MLVRAFATSLARGHRAIPTPPSLPVVGTLPSLIWAGGAPKLHLYVDERHRKLGPIYRESLGNVDAIFVSDARYMRTVFAHEGKHPVHLLPEAWVLYNRLFGCSRGLFFMEAEEWLHNRSLMNNFLMKGDLNYIETACEMVARNFTTKLSNSEIDLENLLYAWSLDTIMAVLLGAEVYENNKTKYEQKLQNLAGTVHLVFQTTSKLQFIPAVLAAKMKLKSWDKFVNSVDAALSATNDLVYDLINEQSNSKGLLKLMLDSKMPKSDIIKIIVDLVLAAGDTTAYTMQWALYLLAKNKRFQTNSNFKNVLKETLRMYPVASFITRHLPQDTMIGPYKIPANDLVLLSLYTSGRDAKYFAKPMEFNPDRWLTKTTTMLQASLPFAMGSRSCVGRKIAELQICKTLERIVNEYEIQMRINEEVEVVMKMVAVPSKPIRLKFVKRQPE